MTTHSMTISRIARASAAARMQHYAGTLRVLLASFPRLSDAFDRESLPIWFILGRGLDRTSRRSRRLHGWRRASRMRVDSHGNTSMAERRPHARNSLG